MPVSPGSKVFQTHWHLESFWDPPHNREVWNHLAFRPGCPFLTTFSVTFNPAYSVGGDAFQKWDESPIFLVNARRKPYYAYEALESGPLQTYFVYFSYSLKLGHLFALLWSSISWLPSVLHTEPSNWNMVGQIVICRCYAKLITSNRTTCRSQGKSVLVSVAFWGKTKIKSAWRKNNIK